MTLFFENDLYIYIYILQIVTIYLENLSYLSFDYFLFELQWTLSYNLVIIGNKYVRNLILLEN